MLQICPKISVVMSVYNGENYLREAIESILNQTFKEFEFVIIDDGSTDNSPEIARSYNDPRIIFIQQENIGLATALNAGVKMAKGKYIARMDADDISMLERLKMQYEFMENHPECVVLGSNANIIDMKGEYLYTSSNPSSWKEINNILPESPFFHSSVIFRKNVFIKCNGYYKEIKHHIEDLILWNKMAEIGELRNIEKALILYRLVPSAISNRSVKDSKIMSSIGLNIIRNSTISKNELEILEKITQKRSDKWREGNYYLFIGKTFLEKNFKRKKAIRNLLISIAKYPFNYTGWFNLILSFLPRTLINNWKRYRLSKQ